MNLAGGLITGGLGLAACEGLITTRFHLVGCLDVVVKPAGGGGGRYPGNAVNVFPNGEFIRSYKPVQYLTPMNHELDFMQKHKSRVVITMTIGEHTMETDYLISDRTSSMLAEISNIVNASKNVIKVMFHTDTIKTITSKALVTVKNIRGFVKRDK